MPWDPREALGVGSSKARRGPGGLGRRRWQGTRRVREEETAGDQEGSGRPEGLRELACMALCQI